MKRGLRIFGLVFLIGILSVSFVSAGLLDWFKELFGGEEVMLSPGEGLIAHYSFENNVRDVSGEGNNGVNYGVGFVEGKVGKAGSFDGVSSYIDVNSSDFGFTSEDFSSCAWVRIPSDAEGGNKRLLSRGVYQSAGWEWFVSKDRSMIRTYQDGASQQSKGSRPSLDSWSHVCFVRKGNSVVFYKDGVEASSVSGTHTNPASYNVNLLVGKYAASGRYNFEGLVDELKIWNRALNEEEVKKEFEGEPTVCQKLTQDIIDFLNVNPITSCEGSEYNPVLDVNKDEIISTLDILTVTNKINSLGSAESEEWCVERLEDDGDVCGGGEGEKNVSECVDSDGGKDYYVKGVVKSKDMSATDACGVNIDGVYNKNILIEHYCSENAWMHENFECPNGCKDGACLPEGNFCGDGVCAGVLESNTLNNGETMVLVLQGVSYELSAIVLSDNEVLITANGENSEKLNKDRKYEFNNGLIIYVEDITYQSYVGGEQSVEFVLGEDSFLCPDDCSECTDSDGGKDYYVEGRTCYRGTCEDDQCFLDVNNNPSLKERFCALTTTKLSTHYLSCPNGCKDGACIPGEGEIVTQTTCQKLTQDIIDFLNVNPITDCGGSEYNPVLDVNKDKIISTLDILTVTNKINSLSSSESEEWCGERLSYDSDPCNGTREVCTGCVLENKCYQIGYRESGDYCSEEGSFIKQLESDELCENNFECGSNLCVSGECVNQGLLMRFLEWFKRFFG